MEKYLGFADPGINFGNADNWGKANGFTNATTKSMKDLGFEVDTTPAVNSIAWFKQGHVGIVVEVGAGYIVVASDNWQKGGGYQDISKLSPGGGWYPTGFIHVEKKAPSIPTPPTTVKPAPSTTPAPPPFPNPNAWYELRNVNSNLCVDTRNGSINNGTAVQQFSCNRTDSQRFRFVSLGGGWFQLVRRNAGSRSLDIQNRSTRNGALVQLWDFTGGGGSNQKWALESVGSGRWRLRVQHSSRCLDVPNASRTSRVQLQQFSCNGTNAQAFTLTVTA